MGGGGGGGQPRPWKSSLAQPMAQGNQQQNQPRQQVHFGSFPPRHHSLRQSVDALHMPESAMSITTGHDEDDGAAGSSASASAGTHHVGSFQDSDMPLAKARRANGSESAVGPPGDTSEESLVPLLKYLSIKDPETAVCVCVCGRV